MVVECLATLALCLIIDDLGEIWTQIVSPEEEYKWHRITTAPHTGKPHRQNG